MMVGTWDDEPQRLTNVVVLAIFCFFAIVATVFRLWARKIQRANFELNDWLAVAGLIWALAESLFTIHSTIYWQLGKDSTFYGNPEAVMKYVVLQLKALIIGQITWATAAFFVRASIFSLYIRIFRTKSFRIACYVVHVINLSYFVSIVFSALLICRPISATWNPQNGHCGKQKSLDLYIGIFNLLLDTTAVVLPLPVLWGLQMSMKKKVVLSGVFSMGIIICVITLVRIKLTTDIRRENAQKIYSMIALLSCLEVLLGTVNCSLPIMRPVFNKVGDSKLWSTFTSSLTSRGSKSRSKQRSRRRSTSGYYKSNESHGANEMRVWPSALSKADPLAPRYVESKAANMMFSHHPTSPSTTPKPPPKSPNHQPNSAGRVGKNSAGMGVAVKKEWDVERGDSTETDLTPLKEDAIGGKGW